MSKVLAKFVCQTVVPAQHDTDEVKGQTITLTPVTTGSAENESFYKWTPGGQITLSTVNQTAAAQFTPGNEYYVTFELAFEAKSEADQAASESASAE
jgi:hypothetical protein